MRVGKNRKYIIILVLTLKSLGESELLILKKKKEKIERESANTVVGVFCRAHKRKRKFLHEHGMNAWKVLITNGLLQSVCSVKFLKTHFLLTLPRAVFIYFFYLSLLTIREREMLQ